MIVFSCKKKLCKIWQDCLRGPDLSPSGACTACTFVVPWQCSAVQCSAVQCSDRSPWPPNGAPPGLGAGALYTLDTLCITLI
jgi:hypothetical protein